MKLCNILQDYRMHPLCHVLSQQVDSVYLHIILVALLVLTNSWEPPWVKVQSGLAQHSLHSLIIPSVYSATKMLRCLCLKKTLTNNPLPLEYPTNQCHVYHPTATSQNHQS